MQDSTRYRCAECGTICKDAPGIGHYCPNQDCSIGDGPGLIEMDSTDEEGEDDRKHVEDVPDGAVVSKYGPTSRTSELLRGRRAFLT